MSVPLGSQKAGSLWSTFCPIAGLDGWEMFLPCRFPPLGGWALEKHRGNQHSRAGGRGSQAPGHLDILQTSWEQSVWGPWAPEGQEDPKLLDISAPVVGCSWEQAGILQGEDKDKPGRVGTSV